MISGVLDFDHQSSPATVLLCIVRYYSANIYCCIHSAGNKNGINGKWLAKDGLAWKAGPTGQEGLCMQGQKKHRIK